MTTFHSKIQFVGQQNKPEVQRDWCVPKSCVNDFDQKESAKQAPAQQA